MTKVLSPMIDYNRRMAIEAPRPRLVSDEEEDEHDFMVADLECWNRVSHLPLVASALNYAQNVYENAKESNVPLLGRTLEAAENVAKNVVHQAQPVVNLFEGPIHLADALCCKSLDVLETAVPAVKQTPEEMVKQAKSYVAAKVQPTAELFSAAKDISQAAAGEAMHQGQMMMETGVSAASAARDIAMSAAESGVEAAASAAEFGMERAGEALEYGAEQAGKAAEFGKAKAMQAARTRYGQMAVKGLERGAMAAEAVAEKVVPPEMTKEVRRGEKPLMPGEARLRHYVAQPTDVRKATEEWEPELKPLGHTVAIGERLFKMGLSIILWQMNMAKRMLSTFFMPMLHPFKFADFVITKTFQTPPAIVRFWTTVFNFCMAFAPWNLFQTTMNVAKWSQEKLTDVLGGVIRFIYFHYVPEDVIEAVRQTRTKLEQTKWTPPELGKTTPKGKPKEEHGEGEGGAVSGYQSFEEQTSLSPIPEKEMGGAPSRQAESTPKKPEEEAPAHPRPKPKHRHEERRPYLYADELAEKGKGEERRPYLYADELAEKGKGEERRPHLHADEREKGKGEERRPHLHADELEKKGKDEERRPRLHADELEEKGKGEERRPHLHVDEQEKGKGEERRPHLHVDEQEKGKGEERWPHLHADELEKGKGEERKPHLHADELEEKGKGEERKPRLHADELEERDVFGKGALEGEAKPETPERVEEKPVEKPKKEERRRTSTEPATPSKRLEEEQMKHQKAEPAGRPKMEDKRPEEPKVEEERKPEEPKMEEEHKPEEPKLEEEHKPEEPKLEEEHKPEEPKVEEKLEEPRMEEEKPEQPVMEGGEKTDIPIMEELRFVPPPAEMKKPEDEGESRPESSTDVPLEPEFFHHAPLPEGVKSPDVLQSEDWRRENMPSVPLESKSPKHHDVVEEGILHEVLPELEDEAQLGTGGDAGLSHEPAPEAAEEAKPQELGGQEQGQWLEERQGDEQQ